VFESWQVLLGKAHSLWQNDAETAEQSGLCGVWLGHAPQANLAMRCGRQDDVLGLNAFEFLQDGAWRIAETCAALPVCTENLNSDVVTIKSAKDRI
jgi:hypothetical protein